MQNVSTVEAPTKGIPTRRRRRAPSKPINRRTGVIRLSHFTLTDTVQRRHLTIDVLSNLLTLSRQQLYQRFNIAQQVANAIIDCNHCTYKGENAKDYVGIPQRKRIALALTDPIDYCTKQTFSGNPAPNWQTLREEADASTVHPANLPEHLLPEDLIDPDPHPRSYVPPGTGMFDDIPPGPAHPAAANTDSTPQLRMGDGTANPPVIDPIKTESTLRSIERALGRSIHRVEEAPGDSARNNRTELALAVTQLCDNHAEALLAALQIKRRGGSARVTLTFGAKSTSEVDWLE